MFSLLDNAKKKKQPKIATKNSERPPHDGVWSKYLSLVYSKNHVPWSSDKIIRQQKANMCFSYVNKIHGKCQNSADTCHTAIYHSKYQKKAALRAIIYSD